MSAFPSPNAAVEPLHNRITSDEDAPVCKGIPESACNDQPYTFFACPGANLLGKAADEIASARLVIPWLFGALGVLPGFSSPAGKQVSWFRNWWSPRR